METLARASAKAKSIPVKHEDFFRKTISFTPFIQPKLTINQPNDPYEQEADAMADKVMRMTEHQNMPQPFFRPIAYSLQRMCADCEEKEKMAQRKEVEGKETAANSELESYVDRLDSGGHALSNEARNFYEPKFGYDFSQVKVHTDTIAAKSAQSINALAYTSGNNIVFNQGQYSPDSSSGKRLLGHELTHVVQQKKNISTKKIQRAVTTINNQRVTVEYGNIIYETNFLTGAQAQVTAFTGVAPVPAVVAGITALSATQQRWLLFALDLLNDNTTAAFAALNRSDAVDRLIAVAPTATTQPFGSGFTFEREVLIFSGWTDVALTMGLSVPVAADQATINSIINPPATGGLPPGPLNVTMFNARLIPALTTLLNAIDPANRSTVARQSMSDILAISDIILAEAREFFSPYSDASRVNVFNLNPTWIASANISDTTTRVPNRAQRINYLTNRGNIVGWNATATVSIPDTNIFADANFDGTRVIDQTELLNIVTTMEADPAIQPIVDRLIQHTGFKTGSGATTHIGIDPEFDSSANTECEARWRTVDTLSHEVLHALVHPDFQNASAAISFGQVVREGFTEVLGNQLFNLHIIPKAAADPAFKASLEVGIASGSCPAPAAGTIGYGSAGTGAETIRTTVNDDRFRAAYFLGRRDLVGI